MSLVNQALELDSNYALAYWQRACANAKLGQHEDALTDIETALSLSASLKDELVGERFFESLQDNEAFQVLAGINEQKSEAES